ncbi:MipA/OmpV family protein [Inquilinus limosus]|uniref:MipA/OmpV family protein n=1 Tax=Inquilinus limosus TaxID=171674 RepID=UPI000410133B|nr:MipA/OmpV family protein [Inquilinus limosus]
MSASFSTAAFSSQRNIGTRIRAPLTFAGACLILAATTMPAGAQEAVILQTEDAPAPPAVDDGSGGDWTFVLGAGARIGPSYEGSDHFSVTPGPFVSVNWRDRIFLDMEYGLGVNVVRTEALRLGLSIDMAPGRDEDDDDHLKGLGDIDAAARGHVFGSYSFGMVQLGLDIAKDFGGSEGLQIRPGVSVKVPLSESWTLSSGLSATWADDDYMQTFFGVSPSQSRRSGLERFDAGAGFKSLDFRVGLNWQISESWVAITSVNVGVLLGDAADSPITQSEVQPSVGLALGYRF